MVSHLRQQNALFWNCQQRYLTQLDFSPYVLSKQRFSSKNSVSSKLTGTTNYTKIYSRFNFIPIEFTNRRIEVFGLCQNTPLLFLIKSSTIWAPWIQWRLEPHVCRSCLHLITLRRWPNWRPISCLKARVAPLKRQTIPHLELLGVLILPQLVNNLNLARKNVKTIYWTDLMMMLRGIKNERTWRQFAIFTLSGRVGRVGGCKACWGGFRRRHYLWQTQVWLKTTWWKRVVVCPGAQITGETLLTWNSILYRVIRKF